MRREWSIYMREVQTGLLSLFYFPIKQISQLLHDFCHNRIDLITLNLNIILNPEVMITNIPIGDIMTKKIIALNRTDDLETAEMLFKKHKIRHIPVVHEDSIIGMLSYTDLLRISFADAFSEDEDEVDTVVYNMFTIEQVMAKKIVSVNSETTIKEVGELLSKNEFHALPVVDDGKLVGIVTTTDLIRYLVKRI